MPITEITLSKHKAKIYHNYIIQTHDSQKQLIIYINESEINGKIDVIVVISLQNTTIKANLSFVHFFTVYSNKLQRVVIAHNNTTLIKMQLRNKPSSSIIRVLSTL